MKHLITLTLLVGCLTASAQTKPKEVMTRTQMPGVVEKILAQPQYKKVVVIDMQDYQTLTGALNDSKGSVIYNPGITADQQVQQQRAIDAYLRELPKRVKLDSVKVEDKP